MTEAISPSIPVQRNRKSISKEEMNRQHIADLVNLNSGEIPEIVKQHKDCYIDPMARSLAMQRVSQAVYKMNKASWVDALGNISNNYNFGKLAGNKNLNLEEFYAICIEELQKQASHADKRNKKGADNSHIGEVYKNIKTEIQNIIQGQITANLEIQEVTGNPKEVVKITGNALLTKFKQDTAEKAKNISNAGLFVLGISNVASGGALMLPQAVLIPLLRLVGMTIADVHKINLEKLDELFKKATEVLETKLSSLKNDLDNGNIVLTKKDAQDLENKLRPFFGLIQNRQDLKLILAKIQEFKNNPVQSSVVTSSLNEILEIKTPNYWSALNSEVENLSLGWKAKLAFNLVPTLGIGLAELGIGASIGQGISNTWENTIGQIIPGGNIPNPTVTPGSGLEDQMDSFNKSISPNPAIVGDGQVFIKPAAATNLPKENFLQASWDNLVNLAGQKVIKLPSDSYLAQIVEKTMLDSTLPKSTNPAYKALADWAEGNKIDFPGQDMIIKNPVFANLTSADQLLNLTPEQIKVLHEALPTPEQKNDFYNAFFNHREFANAKRGFAPAINELKNKATRNTVVTAMVASVVSVFAFSDKKTKRNAILASAGAASIPMVAGIGALPLVIGGAATGYAAKKTVENPQIKEISQKVASTAQEQFEKLRNRDEINPQEEMQKINRLEVRIKELGADPETQIVLLELADASEERLEEYKLLVDGLNSFEDKTLEKIQTLQNQVLAKKAEYQKVIKELEKQIEKFEKEQNPGFLERTVQSIQQKAKEMGEQKGLAKLKNRADLCAKNYYTLTSKGIENEEIKILGPEIDTLLQNPNSDRNLIKEKLDNLEWLIASELEKLRANFVANSSLSQQNLNETLQNQQVGELITLPNSSVQIKFLEQNNSHDCGICSAINVIQFFGGTIKSREFNPDSKATIMNFRKKFYTEERKNKGEVLETFWLGAADVKTILRENPIAGYSIDYPTVAGHRFIEIIEEDGSKITKSEHSDAMREAESKNQWGIVNEYKLGANPDGTISKDYIDRYEGFLIHHARNHFNSIVKKDGKWYKLDSLHPLKIQEFSKTEVYNFLARHEVKFQITKDNPIQNQTTNPEATSQQQRIESLKNEIDNLLGSTTGSGQNLKDRILAAEVHEQQKKLLIKGIENWGYQSATATGLLNNLIGTIRNLSSISELESLKLIAESLNDLQGIFQKIDSESQSPEQQRIEFLKNEIDNLLNEKFNGETLQERLKTVDVDKLFEQEIVKNTKSPHFSTKESLIKLIKFFTENYKIPSIKSSLEYDKRDLQILTQAFREMDATESLDNLSETELKQKLQGLRNEVVFENHAIIINSDGTFAHLKYEEVLYGLIDIDALKVPNSDNNFDLLKKQIGNNLDKEKGYELIIKLQASLKLNILELNNISKIQSNGNGNATILNGASRSLEQLKIDIATTKQAIRIIKEFFSSLQPQPVTFQTSEVVGDGLSF